MANIDEAAAREYAGEILRLSRPHVERQIDAGADSPVMLNGLGIGFFFRDAAGEIAFRYEPFDTVKYL